MSVIGAHSDRTVQSLREQGRLGPLTALSSAFALATLIAIPVNRAVIWAGAGLSEVTGARLVASVIASCRQDAILLLVTAAIHLLLRVNLHANGPRRTIEALFATIYAFVATINALNSVSMRSVGSIFDASWLAYFRPFNLVTAVPPITAALQPYKIALIMVLTVGLPIAAFIAARAIQLRMRTIVWMSASLVCLSLFASLGQSALAHQASVTRRSINPLIHRAILDLFPRGSERALLGDTGSRKSDTSLNDADWTLRAVETSPKSCCRGANLLLITIDTVPLKRVTPKFIAANARRFPNLAWLYRNSRVFDNFYSNYPTSAPAFTTLLSSTYPTNSLFRFTTEELADRAMPTLPNVLSSRGYRTAHFMSGELRFASADRYIAGRGFDVVADSSTLRCRTTDDETFRQYAQLGDDCTALAANRWLGLSDRRPFFLWLWLSNPHAPYFTRARGLLPVANPGSAEFLAAIAETDSAIGEVLSRLRRLGKLDTTLIMLSADHGEAFGEHGLTNHGGAVFDEQVRIPFLLRIPGGPEGMVDHRIGSLVDVVPTALDLLGINVADRWQGRSILAFDHPRRAYFLTARGGRSGGYREGRYKFVLSDLDTAPVAYDLLNDPDELRPVPLSPAMTDRVLGRMTAFVAYRSSLDCPTRAEPKNPVAAAAIR